MDLTTSAPGLIAPNLCFCIRWDLWVTYCIPVYSGCETLRHYFHARVGPDRFDKKSARTSDAKQAFVHRVGSAVHVVHSSAFQV
jgi:hypothetical protein